MPTATDTGRARELRLRRRAQSLGLRLSKARGRIDWPWWLSRLGDGRCVFGNTWGGKTLDEIETYLDGL